jgi:hypothetical protein
MTGTTWRPGPTAPTRSFGSTRYAGVAVLATFYAALARRARRADAPYIKHMGTNRVVPFGHNTRRGDVPEHFRPEERQAWEDIVGTMAPLHFMDEVDMYVLECAAATLASFRSYSPHLDEVTRARHAKVLSEILEEALVPTSAIPGLVKL